VAGFRRSVIVDRPVEAVYDYLVDLERGREWMPGVRESQVLTAGPLRVGTRFRDRRVAGGRERVTDIEVVEVVPGRRHAVQLSTLGMTMRFAFDLAPVGDSRTLVEYEAALTSPLVVRPLLAVVARAVESEDDDILERFKRAAETALPA
jgi:uncharacterized membrane protein